jgi:hypothetical protein
MHDKAEDIAGGQVIDANIAEAGIWSCCNGKITLE